MRQRKNNRFLFSKDEITYLSKDALLSSELFCISASYFSLLEEETRKICEMRMVSTKYRICTSGGNNRWLCKGKMNLKTSYPNPQQRLMKNRT